jgi:hypothetical protein
VGGNDFYSSPRLSQDGMKLAWVTWSRLKHALCSFLQCGFRCIVSMPFPMKGLCAALEDGSSEVLVGGNDFYSSPRLSQDGTNLAWVTWSHPKHPLFSSLQDCF